MMHRTDQELADWVAKNFVPAEASDQASRAQGIANRVLAVIREIRSQYEPTEHALALSSVEGPLAQRKRT